MTKILPLIIILFVSIIYTLPFFQSGYFPTHDGEWAVVRLTEMYREVKDAQIPPGWSDYLNHGYGYPLFSFTYPLPYYLGLIIKATGIGFVASIKILFIASVILSGAGMYFLAKELTGSTAGLLASVIYIVAPFRLENLYVRGSLGESLAMALFPFISYLGLRYIINPTAFKMAATACVLAALILTHNVMALFFIPFWILFLYAAVFSFTENAVEFSWKRFLPLWVLGLGMAAYFFLPALVEKKYIALSVTKLADVSGHFIAPDEFITSGIRMVNKPAFYLGWFNIAAAAISVLTFIFAPGVEKRKYKSIFWLLIISISVSLFLTQPQSEYLWNNTILASVDFPWRLMPFISFLMSLAVIYLPVYLITRWLGIALIIAAAVTNMHIAKPQERISKPDEYYITNDATTTSMDELMPVWVKIKPTDRYINKVEVVKGVGRIEDLQYNSRMISFTTDSTEELKLLVNTHYFPGWKVSVDGQKTEIDHENLKGLIVIDVPPGDHQVEGKFTQTPVRKFSWTVSIISSIITLLFIGYGLLTRIKIQNYAQKR